MFACKCLNILIHSENNDIMKVEKEFLQLSDEERNDLFFKKEIGQVTLGNISKEQIGLVHTRTIGPWIIHHCLNCNLDTHAVHRDRGASCVLITCDLLSGSSNIAALRNSETYSTAFRVLINPKFTDDNIDQTVVTGSQLPPNVQLAISMLQQKLTEVLRQEVTDTEERIRKFSELQFAALESFREQAHREHHALVRLVLNSQPNIEIMKIDSPADLSSTSESVKIDDVPVNQQSITKPKHPAVTNLSTKTKRTAARQLIQSGNKTDSLDTEGLFLLEGMEDLPTVAHSDIEESDTDDSASHDEGIHIPRQRLQSTSIAKSLPMNIPVFMSAFSHDVREKKPDFKPNVNDDSVDIAASIKALAKSVHGDAVFGDLPRPRFSTQI